MYTSQVKLIVTKFTKSTLNFKDMFQGQLICCRYLREYDDLHVR